MSCYTFPQMFKSNSMLWVLFTAFTTLFVCGIYVSMMRGFYTAPYDRGYVTDLYDHAQYVIPQSFRGISDELVYQTIGDRLVKDQQDPFSIDPQVPPLGKMLYGWSIYLFGNAYALNIFSFCLASMGVYALGRVIGLSKKRSFFASLVFMLQPLVIVQMRKTMLDLLQTATLLWFLACFVWQTKQHMRMRIGSCFVAGILLGFTACIKFGLFLVPIVFALLPLIRLPRKQLIACIFILCLGFGLGYSLPYTSHISHVGVVQFAKNQKWLLSFWMGAGDKIHANIGMPLITLVFGLYKHFTIAARWSLQGEWSPILSIATIFLVVQLKSIKTWLFSEKPQVLPLRITLFLLLLYCVVPFYPRYLVILTPLLILTWISSCKKQPLQITAVISVAIVSVLLPFYTKDSLTEFVSSLGYNAHHALYKELYMMSDRGAAGRETREDFWTHNLRAWNQIEGSDLTFDVKPINLDHFKSQIDVPYTISYKTYLGTISQKGTLHIYTVGGVRKFQWKDDLIIPHFTKSSTLTARKVFGQPGTIHDSRGALLAEETLTPHLVILKKEILDEKIVLNTSALMTGKEVYEVENAFKTNHIDDQPALIGSIVTNVSTLGGLPSGMYITYLPHVADHLRARYPTAFSVMGGEIVVQDRGTRVTLLTRKAIDGRDIVLDR